MYFKNRKSGEKPPWPSVKALWWRTVDPCVKSGFVSSVVYVNEHLRQEKVRKKINSLGKTFIWCTERKKKKKKKEEGGGKEEEKEER